jgi:hypothetical protein
MKVRLGVPGADDVSYALIFPILASSRAIYAKYHLLDSG